VAFGPHDSGVSARSSSVRANSVAPLTLANIVVTDLATNQATLYSYDNPAPIYSTGSAPCTSDPTAYLCMSFGNGGYLMIFAGGINAGRTYVSPNDVIQVAAEGSSCGGPNSGAAAAAELDQYVAASSPTRVQTTAVQFDCTNASVDISGTIAYNVVPTDPQNGYYVFGQQGEIAGFGNDNYLSYLDGAQYYNLNAPIVSMAPTPDGGGYWMVGSDGGVFSSGDAQFYGSTGNIRLNKPVVGMAATPDGKGYWFVASDGGIFAYGDAPFYGSRGGQPLNKPIVGMAATPDGKGYWLVASDGGIFSYGDAGFFGSTGNLHLNQPVVGMTPTPSGHGYWFVASDGGIFAYGDAGFYGSTGAIHLNKPIVGMAAAPDGHGYWFVASDGGVFNYGSAGFAGSLGGTGVTDAAGISTGI
jgi:ribosomal protein L24E